MCWCSWVEVLLHWVEMGGWSAFGMSEFLTGWADRIK